MNESCPWSIPDTSSIASILSTFSFFCIRWKKVKLKKCNLKNCELNISYRHEIIEIGIKILLRLLLLLLREWAWYRLLLLKHWLVRLDNFDFGKIGLVALLLFELMHRIFGCLEWVRRLNWRIQVLRFLVCVIYRLKIN